ncbi:PepSY domain-containing protein [Pseudalkalibacillus salsuginis]|uniref:PepSY domain-containing protein n=1 Tax=Pseudalkalibacillus salsuginis TaxID=2910972 RepID=UPI001F48A61E|nr:PepSY domain-containing protein [Pseudalkalibacillus salsuginis]MCF6408831.1 PepSY domain-containing protein [Pseudalkalibacillus salsuginis]
MKTSTILGTIIGFAAGVLLTKQLSSRPITPELALKTLKQKVPSKMSGSWIYTIKESVEMNGLSYNVYKGGFTQSTSSGEEHYLFTVDADTGSVLEIANTNI